MDPVYLVSSHEGRWVVTNDGTRIASLPTMEDAVLAARLMASQRLMRTGKRGELVVHGTGHIEVVYKTEAP